MRTFVTIGFEIPAPHTLAKPDLSEAEIEAYFSDCGKRHGHNYFIEVSFLRSPRDGLEENVSIRDLKDETEGFLHNLLLGKDLNHIYDNTSGEALASSILTQIRALPWGKAVLRLAIRETKKNSFVSEIKI